MSTLSQGNAAGAIAIALWSTLALLTVLTGSIPPFQLTAMALSIAFGMSLVLWVYKGASLQVFKGVPWRVWGLGVYGIFGYHFFYFLALKSAPSLEANLINYLWPLLIVLFSALLPNERLRWFHLVGIFFGFLGAFVLLGFGEIALDVQYLQGYLYALVAAFIWSSYSVLSRLFGTVSTWVVGGFCGLGALCSWGAHFLFEQPYTPTLEQLLAIIALGLGPVGIAFFVWDVGMKRGNIQWIGTLSYATPLLSTLLLILLGHNAPTTGIWVACGLIMTGSIIASLGMKRG